ncbi:MAG: efflux RND transporter periplasmic adaptor subunit [Bradymonadia bacterium]
MQTVSTPSIWLSGIMLSALLAGCQKPPPEKKTVIRPVRAIVVEQADAQRTRVLSGTAQAGAETQLSFKVNGTLKSLAVKVGDEVKKGQRLAELDDSDYKLQLSEARASAGAARAQSRSAKASYDRVRKLYANGNAAKADLDAARSGYESARAQLASTGQRIKLLQKQVKYTVLSAPADGVVAATISEVNENLGSGQPVITLNTGGRTEVVVAVPESLISEVEPQATVQVKFPAANALTIPGTVTEISPAARGQSTFPVTVVLEKEDAQVRPGMAAEITFTFGEANAAPRIIVPLVAVGEDREGRHVLVVNDVKEGQGKVARVMVTVGDISEQGMEITEGLKGGELLVTAGLRHIQPGLTVKLMPELLATLGGEAQPKAAPKAAPEGEEPTP